ncbi:hypothetical protein QTN25_000804 [Entamoeba marina]
MRIFCFTEFDMSETDDESSTARKSEPNEIWGIGTSTLGVDFFGFLFSILIGEGTLVKVFILEDMYISS